MWRHLHSHAIGGVMDKGIIVILIIVCLIVYILYNSKDDLVTSLKVAIGKVFIIKYVRLQKRENPSDLDSNRKSEE